MQATAAGLINATAECAAAANPTLRIFTVKPGGASSGQPKTTHANWAQATKGYSDFQRCNPIRKDATFGALKYAE